MAEHLTSKEKVSAAVLDSFIDEYQPGCEMHRMLVELRDLRRELADTREAYLNQSARLVRADSQPQIIRGVVEQFGQYIVHGTPGHYGWLPEDHELQHNCDAMACGQDHALARFQIERATPPPFPAPKFKVGDWVKLRRGHYARSVLAVCGPCYVVTTADGDGSIQFGESELEPASRPTKGSDHAG
jgi:hypothetical protein